MSQKEDKIQPNPIFSAVKITMSYDTISLHFSESETSMSGSPVSRLPGESDDRTSGSRVHLIIDQMPKSLVIGRSEEYLCSNMESLIFKKKLLNTLSFF